MAKKLTRAERSAANKAAWAAMRAGSARGGGGGAAKSRSAAESHARSAGRSDREAKKLTKYFADLDANADAVLALIAKDPVDGPCRAAFRDMGFLLQHRHTLKARNPHEESILRKAKKAEDKINTCTE